MPVISNDQNNYEPILKSSSKKIIVVAGPGSGKTSGILIPKAKQLLGQISVDCDEVLLLTFSRLAALDLKKKVKTIGDKVPRASTIHSLCLSFLLTENDHDIRKRINTIVLDFEKDILISDIKITLLKINKRKLKKLLEEFSAGWAVNPHDEVFNESEEKLRFKSAVINWLDEYEAAMMEEIVYNAVQLGKKIQSDFIKNPQYILVDEYQDLNALEQEFINLLATESELLLVVGDPDQSIYSFKYAYPEGINSFKQKMGVESHFLKYTGRCSKKIVEFANKLLIQDNPGRVDLLKPLPSNPNGYVEIKCLDTQEDEFNYIIQSIKQNLDNGIIPKDIIVLVPRKKLGVELLKYAKDNHVNINLILSNKAELSLLEQEKILLFGLLANPNSLLRTRSLLGLDSSGHFSAEIATLKQKYGSLKNMYENAKHEDFNKKNIKLHKLIEKINEIKEFIVNNAEKPLADLLNSLFPEEDLELKDIREIILKLKEDDDNINTLYSKLVDYTQTIEAKDNQIRIMTLMLSKGLEAKWIYVIGCNNGNLPGKNRSVYLNDYQFKQEQRRLLYVAATRAKENLIITWCRFIPFRQAMGQHTAPLGIRTINGNKYCTVGISEFLI